MLPGDQFIYQQIGAYLASEPAVYTAYVETASSGGVVGGLTRKAYWAALTGTRLYLIEASVGAFKPMMENKGLQVIERAQITGVHHKGNSLVIALANGPQLSLEAKPRPDLVSGQALFCAELATRHGGTPVATEIQKSARLKTIAGVAIGLAVAGWYGYQLAYGGRAEVSVYCAPENDAIACSVEHTYGGADAKACWDYKVKCQNQSQAVAHACEEVGTGQTAKVVLTESDFRGIEGCNAPAGTELLNLEIEVD